MIDEGKIRELVNQFCDETELIVIEISVGKSNNVRVLVDTIDGITIKECSKLSKYLESQLDRETEDFQLEVSSPGLSEPLKVPAQFTKNLGKQIEIVTEEGLKHKGELLKASDSSITILEKIKVKKDKKRKEIEEVENSFSLDKIKLAKVVVSFK